MSGWAVYIELSLPVGVYPDPGTEGFSTENDVPVSLGSPLVSSKGGVESQVAQSHPVPAPPPPPHSTCTREEWWEVVQWSTSPGCREKWQQWS